MASSLQDQLLKAGLVKKQELKQVRTAQHKHSKQGGKNTPATETAAVRAAAEQARIEKMARDRELNRQRQEEAALHAAENEIRQLIHAHRIVRDGGELAYNFTDGVTLKRVYVNKEQHAKLVSGQLAIVRQDAFYEVIPAEIVARVCARAPDLVVVDNRATAAAAADDPYAEFQVPDDLMW
jgi:uncharacterized protein